MKRSTLRQVAMDSAVSADELEDLADRLDDDLRDHLDDYLDIAYWQTGPAELLAETGAAYVFAVGLNEWENLRDQLDLEDREMRALKMAHDERARALLAGTGREKAFEALDPLVIPYPENWSFAKEMQEWEFQKLVTDGLSPAEALDFWMVERQEWPAKKWADSRNVHPESVRKNVRQASEKLSQ